MSDYSFFQLSLPSSPSCLHRDQVNTSNIKHVVPELFGENLIRGKGLFARSIMRAQASSLPFTPIFAALVAIINTKLPQVGELVLIRLISQFRRAYKRNDKVSPSHCFYLIMLSCTPDRLSCYIHLHRPPLQPIRLPRDRLPSNPPTLSRSPYRRLDRGSRRLHARSWSLPVGKQSEGEQHGLRAVQGGTS